MTTIKLIERFAHLRGESAGTEARWGTAAHIDQLFQQAFVMERMVPGNTWLSGWYWLRRNEN